MAFNEALESITRLASADLSANQYHFMKLNSSGKAELAGAGEAAVGVLQNKPDALDKDATIGFKGISKVVCAAALAPNTKVMSDASGEAVAATATNHVLGIHVGDATSASGDVIPVLLLSAHVL